MEIYLDCNKPWKGSFWLNHPRISCLHVSSFFRGWSGTSKIDLIQEWPKVILSILRSRPNCRKRSPQKVVSKKIPSKMPWSCRFRKLARNLPRWFARLRKSLPLTSRFYVLLGCICSTNVMKLRWRKCTKTMGRLVRLAWLRISDYNPLLFFRGILTCVMHAFACLVVNME